MFSKFLADTEADEMFITGQAGTGKTTGLHKLVMHCVQNDVAYVVCAYTHKACGILRSKLPPFANVRTLHSYLKKRPSINTEAQSYSHIEVNVSSGSTDRVAVLFIDEYSMIGERDLMDIRAQDIKVVWLGDPNQLPPVNDAQAVVPYGKYCKVLTKVYRQADSSPLLDTLCLLVSYIEGATAKPLEAHEALIRGQDIVEWYDNDRLSDDFDGVMLAYTNERVEYLNCLAQGRAEPEPGDLLYSPTTKQRYVFKKWLTTTEAVAMPFGEPLQVGTKYKTLEFLLAQDYGIAVVEDEEHNELTFMCIFGHHQYKLKRDELKQQAVASNKAIGKDAAQWAGLNKGTRKAKERAKAWRQFLSFNDAVICLDFTHAMTVHKSQGSTYKSIYLDTEDLNRVMDYKTYLRLMYVAISRARDYVVTN